MANITTDKIKEINEVYYRLKTYAATAREVGCSPATVKKYVNVDYKPESEREFIRVTELPEFNEHILLVKDWSEMCQLSQEERDEITRLWEELDV